MRKSTTTRKCLRRKLEGQGSLLGTTDFFLESDKLTVNKGKQAQCRCRQQSIRHQKQRGSTLPPRPLMSHDLLDAALVHLRKPAPGHECPDPLPPHHKDDERQVIR